MYLEACIFRCQSTPAVYIYERRLAGELFCHIPLVQYNSYPGLGLAEGCPVIAQVTWEALEEMVWMPEGGCAKSQGGGMGL